MMMMMVMMISRWKQNRELGQAAARGGCNFLSNAKLKLNLKDFKLIRN